MRDAFRWKNLGALIESLNLIMMDVGARGGVDDDFLPAAWCTMAIGFEPDTAECARLNGTPQNVWKEVRYIPSGIGHEAGRAILHIPASPVGASLYEHNETMIPRFGHPELHRTQRCIEIPITTVDAVVSEQDLKCIDYLKIDVEGAESDTLKGAKEAMKQVSALKIECSFLEQRKKQPLIWEVVAEVMDQGFICAELLDIHYWRRRPLPAHPYVARHAMPYSRGVAAQCDLVFLRDFHFSTPEHLTRLFVVAAILGHFDYAMSIAREMPRIEESLAGAIGEDWFKLMAEVSRKVGRWHARRVFCSRLRSLWPLSKSAFLSGVSSPDKEMKY